MSDMVFVNGKHFAIPTKRAELLKRLPGANQLHGFVERIGESIQHFRMSTYRRTPAGDAAVREMEGK